MERDELIKVMMIVGGTAVVSWMFGVETLFFLGIVVTAALAVVVGSILGMMIGAERLMAAFSKEKAWSPVRAGATRQSVAS